MNNICSICLINLNDDDSITHLHGCSHIFHTSCIVKYFRMPHSGGRCPNCRHNPYSTAVQDPYDNIFQAQRRKRKEIRERIGLARRCPIIKKSLKKYRKSKEDYINKIKELKTYFYEKKKELEIHKYKQKTHSSYTKYYHNCVNMRKGENYGQMFEFAYPSMHLLYDEKQYMNT
jgi:hypothetical protein